MTRRHKGSAARESRDHLWTSRLTAEAFGTFLLTLTACAVEIVAATHPEISYGQRAAASGVVVLAMIYSVSDISGAHFNPAVTFAFALRGVFDWRRVHGYWLAQFTGALAGAAVAWAVVGSAGNGGATVPKVGAARAVAVEALLAMFLVSVIIHTSKRKAAVGTEAAIAVGATIAVCGFWGGPLTGASMNPARSFGPAIVADHLESWWIYAVGPALGAIAAVVLAFLIHGPRSTDEEEAAKGEGRE